MTIAAIKAMECIEKICIIFRSVYCVTVWSECIRNISDHCVVDSLRESKGIQSRWKDAVNRSWYLRKSDVDADDSVVEHKDTHSRISRHEQEVREVTPIRDCLHDSPTTDTSLFFIFDIDKPTKYKIKTVMTSWRKLAYDEE